MNLKTPSWYSLAVQNGGDVEVYIYDEIGIYGVSAKSFIEELASVPNAVSITLRINSPGGSVFDALAIYNVLKSKPMRKVCIVDGMAASAASFIPMACDEIRMHANAFMFLHNPWVMTAGNADQLRGEAETLDKLQDQLVSIYAGRTGMAREQVEALLDAETWLTAEECAMVKLCDTVLGSHQIAARFNPQLYKHIPCEIAASMSHEEPKMDEQPVEVVEQPSVEPVAVVEPAKVEEPVPVVSEPAELVEQPAAVVDTRAEFKRFVDRFGSERAAGYFASGASFEEAERDFVAAIERENAELKAKLAKVEVPTAPAKFDAVQDTAVRFTRAQIRGMSSEEYKQNRQAIIAAERRGEIK